MDERRDSIPVIYARGTHYEVGYTVGSTFKSMIQDFLATCSHLNDDLIPNYKTTEGKQAYDQTLAVIQETYPQYLEELTGTAEGSGAPFYQLFLLHLNALFTNNVHQANSDNTGCSTIICNQPRQVLIGHNEDAHLASLNRCYIVQADIEVAKGSHRECNERFTAFCYPGHMPGFYMGYNHHGFVFSVNVIVPEKCPLGRMPSHFVTRALLGAKDLQQVIDTLRHCGGPGIGDGLSINLGFWEPERLAIPTDLYNIEVGPGITNCKSQVDIIAVTPGQTILHCNRYQRLNILEVSSFSSTYRKARYSQLPTPKDRESILDVLGDSKDPEFPIFRVARVPDKAMTVATGIFDFTKGTWSLYIRKPARGASPVCTIPLRKI